MSLTREQAQNYERDGILWGVPVFASREADRYRTLFDALEAQEGPDKCRVGLLNRHFDQSFVWEIATHPTILDAVEALMGPDILLLATHFFCKYGQDGKWVAWHQDLTYWGLEPAYALTAWYAVDDSDTENGCMRAIPGSHRRGILEHGKSAKGGNLLSINQEVVVTEDDERRAVDMPLKAGEISLHDGGAIHGSLPNRSTRRRCGITLRYVPPYVKSVRKNSLDKDWPAILVRGNDAERNFGGRELPFPLATRA